MNIEQLLDEMFKDDLGDNFDVNFNFDGTRWSAVFLDSSSESSVLAVGRGKTPQEALENLLM